MEKIHQCNRSALQRVYLNKMHKTQKPVNRVHPKRTYLKSQLFFNRIGFRSTSNIKTKPICTTTSKQPTKQTSTKHFKQASLIHHGYKTFHHQHNQQRQNRSDDELQENEEEIKIMEILKSQNNGIVFKKKKKLVRNHLNYQKLQKKNNKRYQYYQHCAKFNLELLYPKCKQNSFLLSTKNRKEKLYHSIMKVNCVNKIQTQETDIQQVSQLKDDNRERQNLIQLNGKIGALVRSLS